jgi:anti-sigma B factor antagonist
MSSHDLPFSADAVDHDGDVVLSLTGELDIATAPKLGNVVNEVAGPYLRRLTVDLGCLSFVDVVGLRALLDARRTTVATNAKFRLCSVSDLTLRVIRLVDLPGLEDAVEAASEHF